MQWAYEQGYSSVWIQEDVCQGSDVDNVVVMYYVYHFLKFHILFRMNKIAETNVLLHMLIPEVDIVIRNILLCVFA